MVQQSRRFEDIAGAGVTCEDDTRFDGVRIESTGRFQLNETNGGLQIEEPYRLTSSDLEFAAKEEITDIVATHGERIQPFTERFSTTSSWTPAMALVTFPELNDSHNSGVSTHGKNMF